MAGFSTCIKCGRTGQLVDGRLCPNCYLEVYGLGVFPKTIRVTVCSRCGAYKFHGRWFPGADGIEDAVKLLLQVSFRPTEHVDYYRIESLELVHDKYHGDYARVRVVGRLKGFNEEYERDYLVRISIVKQLCPSCFRRAAGAAQAVVQVRGWGGRLSEELRERLYEFLSNLPAAVMDNVIEIEEVREGINVKVLDHATARLIASKIRAAFAAKVVESHKLVGRRSDGKRLSKLTISVRLPFFSQGSIVDYDGRLALVEEITGGYVYVKPLGSRRRHRVPLDKSWTLLTEPYDARKQRVMVAAITPSSIHLQLLEGGYEYMEYRRRDLVVVYEPNPGQEAYLVEYRGKLYLLPDELAQRLP